MWRACFRYVSHSLHQLALYPAHACSAALQGDRDLAKDCKVGIRDRKRPLCGHKPERRRILPIYRTPYHHHRILGIRVRKQSDRNLCRRDVQTLVSAAARHCTHIRHVQALPLSVRHAQSREPSVRRHSRVVDALLRRTDFVSARFRTGLHYRNARWSHNGRTSHHHQQRQPVCRHTDDGRPCTQYSVFTDTYHRQTDIHRTAIFRTGRT